MAQDVCWFRQAPKTRGKESCILPNSNRKTEIPLDRVLYKIENMFGKLKDWRRIQTRYDRYAPAFMSAIAIATTVIVWINQCVLRQNWMCEPKLA